MVVFSAVLGRYISGRSVMAAAAASGNKIESAQDIQTWFTGYGLDVDAATIAADKVKIPRRWDDSFSAFNGVVQQSGMDLTRYKGKTVEKWTALLPAVSKGDTMSYGVLLVYKKKAIGAYLLEKPSGVVTGLKDAQTAMAMQEATEVSGEDFSGDWGERHDEELGASGQAMETSGEDFSGDWGERHDEELNASGRPPANPRRLCRKRPAIRTSRWTPRGTLSSEWESEQKSFPKAENCAMMVLLIKDYVQLYQNFRGKIGNMKGCKKND